MLHYSYSLSSGVSPQGNEYPRQILPGKSSIDPIVEYLEQDLHVFRPLRFDVTQVMGQLGPGDG